jgi:hypothetical protein
MVYFNPVHGVARHAGVRRGFGIIGHRDAAAAVDFCQPGDTVIECSLPVDARSGLCLLWATLGPIRN